MLISAKAYPTLYMPNEHMQPFWYQQQKPLENPPPNREMIMFACSNFGGKYIGNASRICAKDTNCW